MKTLIIACWISAGVFLALASCSKADLGKEGEGFDFLSGTWVDKESYALQFIEFQSSGRGRFGMFGKQSKEYTPFHYTLVDSILTIRFDGHDDYPESTHKLSRMGDDIITISDLTVIPENPDKTYLRTNLVTDRVGDTIVIGEGELYYDFENDFRIQIDSFPGDSRCPEGVQCFWAGNAKVRFEIIAEGNYRHLFDLNTHGGPMFPHDTVINDIEFRLVEVGPYPKFDAPSDYYKNPWVKLLASPK